MSIETALDRYFDAWNSHDPDLVVAALTDDGTYEDPTTGGPISGDALAASVAGVLRRVPRRALRHRQRSVDRATPRPRSGACSAPTPDRCPAARPPAAAVDLPGADFFTYDADADR